MYMRNNRVIFDKSIERWENGIPLGNGKIGAYIWGTPGELRICMDRTDLWDRTVPMNTDRKEFTYQRLTEMAKSGQTEEIRELFDAPYNAKAPTKLPAGKILLTFPEAQDINGYLDLETACAGLSIKTREDRIEVKAYCHAENKSGFIEIQAEKDKDGIGIRLLPPGFGRPDEEIKQKKKRLTRNFIKGSLKELIYPKPIEGIQEGFPSYYWFIQSVDQQFSYGIIMGILRGKKVIHICYRIITSLEGEEWLEDAKGQIYRELALGQEDFAAHTGWWEDYWKKSNLRLPDLEFEKQWYLANYLFASCSRKGEYPMPLQGLWMVDDGMLPPWKGDYHNDLNTQFSYTHFYQANHLEEGESFLDFLWKLRPAGREFAEKFYGTKGVCLPGVMTIDGKPLGGWPMYSLVPVHQIWLCQSFDLYYRYTGDEEFLREKAWIYLEETAECISPLLEKRGGKLYLPVSSSPELHDDEAASWVTPNSNYDLALLRYLYKTLVEYALWLKNGREEIWQNYLDKLPDLAVNDNSVLMISPTESLQESHRHLSNAMAIWPLKLLDYEQHKEIIDATILDYEKWGSGMWVGFSFVWMSHLYSVQGNGEGACEQLRIFWESFCSSNGFHLNGDYKKRGYSTFHYKPFTLEANFCAANALQEMLLQNKENEIRLFYGIPERWRKREFSFENFRSFYGMMVSAFYHPEEGVRIRIYSPMRKKLTVKVKGFGVKEIELEGEEQQEIMFEIEGNCLEATFGRPGQIQ
ncbi:MAG: glycosyl hydrolase family 95 catalytic domain-containing protein [Lachnospiraceae bacterium]